MSLDISVGPHWQNITHNLYPMAKAAGFGHLLWGDVPVKNAAALADAVEVGLDRMRTDPAKFKAMDAPNGWGTYEQFVPWLEQLAEACRRHPDAEVECSR